MYIKNNVHFTFHLHKCTCSVASFPGSPRYAILEPLDVEKRSGREPGRFYHVSDVKGREKLIVRGHSNHNAYTSARISLAALCKLYTRVLASSGPFGIV